MNPVFFSFLTYGSPVFCCSVFNRLLLRKFPSPTATRVRRNKLGGSSPTEDATPFASLFLWIITVTQRSRPGLWYCSSWDTSGLLPRSFLRLRGQCRSFISARRFVASSDMTPGQKWEPWVDMLAVMQFGVSTFCLGIAAVVEFGVLCPANPNS